MIRRTTGIALLALVLFLASLSGLTDSLWSEAKTVRGTVSTVEGDLVWFFRSCDDPEAEGKDVGTWTVKLDSSDPDQKTLLVTLGNGYPGYHFYCDLHLANSGTLPVKVKEVRVINPNPQALAVTAHEDLDEVGKELEPCGFTPDWGTKPPNVPAKCRTEIQLTVHIEHGAEQNANYRFSVEVELEQG